MAWVKTFRIHPDHGVPDKDIREFVKVCEREGIVRVTAIPIPATTREGVQTADPRLTVIVTKLDDYGVDREEYLHEVQAQEQKVRNSRVTS